MSRDNIIILAQEIVDDLWEVKKKLDKLSGFLDKQRSREMINVLSNLLLGVHQTILYVIRIVINFLETSIEVRGDDI